MQGVFEIENGVEGFDLDQWAAGTAFQCFWSVHKRASQTNGDLHQVQRKKSPGATQCWFASHSRFQHLRHWQWLRPAHGEGFALERPLGSSWQTLEELHAGIITCCEAVVVWLNEQTTKMTRLPSYHPKSRNVQELSSSSPTWFTHMIYYVINIWCGIRKFLTRSSRSIWVPKWGGHGTSGHHVPNFWSSLKLLLISQYLIWSPMMAGV